MKGNGSTDLLCGRCANLMDVVPKERLGLGPPGVVTTQGPLVHPRGPPTGVLTRSKEHPQLRAPELVMVNNGGRGPAFPLFHLLTPREHFHHLLESAALFHPSFTYQPTSLITGASEKAICSERRGLLEMVY